MPKLTETPSKPTKKKTSSPVTSSAKFWWDHELRSNQLDTHKLARVRTSGTMGVKTSSWWCLFSFLLLLQSLLCGQACQGATRSERLPHVAIEAIHPTDPGLVVKMGGGSNKDRGHPCPPSAFFVDIMLSSCIIYSTGGHAYIVSHAYIYFIWNNHEYSKCKNKHCIHLHIFAYCKVCRLQGCYSHWMSLKNHLFKVTSSAEAPRSNSWTPVHRGRRTSQLIKENWWVFNEAISKKNMLSNFHCLFLSYPRKAPKLRCFKALRKSPETLAQIWSSLRSLPAFGSIPPPGRAAWRLKSGHWRAVGAPSRYRADVPWLVAFWDAKCWVNLWEVEKHVGCSNMMGSGLIWICYFDLF